MHNVKLIKSDSAAAEARDRDMALGKIEGIDVLAGQFEEVGNLGYFIFDAVIEQFLYVSSGFGLIYGVDPKTHVNNIKSLDDDLALIVEQDRDRVLACYQKYLCQGINCVVEYRIRRADGKIRWLRESSKALRIDNDKVLLTMGVVQDITTQLIFGNELLKNQHQLEQIVEESKAELDDTVKLLQREIREREHLAAELDLLSRHDALTGLPTLSLCRERLDYAMIESNFSHQSSAVLFIDLDEFKSVNNALGREAGDLLLKRIADRMKAEIRQCDTLARVGGDGVILILNAVGARRKIERIAASLIRRINVPLDFDQRQLQVGGSIGIAVYPGDSNTAKELIGQADRAMCYVKSSGKNNFSFFDEHRQ